MIVYFHAEAEAEVLEARAWYAERSEIAARAFATEVDWAVREIGSAPERWKRHEYGTRWFMLPNFPFSIVYRVHQDAVQVVAVVHHRRRPGYWRGR
ncbi:MAG: type II toxin-antitoxin system RelE/ParE family toxin [Gammaproteobacteria bacterium]